MFKNCADVGHYLGLIVRLVSPKIYQVHCHHSPSVTAVGISFHRRPSDEIHPERKNIELYFRYC
jgi:hypothetical protein